MARLAFLGTPGVACTVLDALVVAGHEVVAVVSGPDRRRSRGAPPSPSPVKARALELGLAVADSLESLDGCDAQLGVVVAYGRLVPAALLVGLPMLNVHFSLLPRWRGAAPVERAILAGDERTGVCIMGLEAGLDTGPVYACREVAIGEAEHADALTDRLGVLGAQLLVEVLANGVGGLPTPFAQQGEATYAHKLTPAELELDFTAPAVACARRVRVGRAWTLLGPERLRVLDARPRDAEGPLPAPGTLIGASVATGAGWLELLEVQRAGRGPQSFAEFARGARLSGPVVLGRGVPAR